jgi:hypothetical protein
MRCPRTRNPEPSTEGAGRGVKVPLVGVLLRISSDHYPSWELNFHMNSCLKIGNMSRFAFAFFWREPGTAVRQEQVLGNVSPEYLPLFRSATTY